MLTTPHRDPVVEVSRAVYDVPAAETELKAIEVAVEAERLTDDMICRLCQLRADMAMRLAFFRDHPEGIGKCPPGTLYDMGVLEAKIEVLLEAIEDDDELLAEV
jgi:hypothetical protein